MVGSNALFLQEDAARELLGQRESVGRMTAGFDSAVRAGVRVLRVAAFNDGTRDSAAIQPQRGVLSEAGLRGLDQVIAEAGRRDIMLLMVLSNYWNDYGGLAQYLRWRGYDPEDRGRVFYDPQLFGDLRDYAVAIAQRVNSFTGVRYGDDPIILGWEIMNEPRGEGLSDRGEQHTRFLADMARAIRAVAPHQMVVAGDEGFDLDLHDYDMTYWDAHVEARVLGPPRHQSYHMTAIDPAFDTATLHFYPEVWGVRLGNELESGIHWIHEHAVIAERSHKPVLFEEFGLGDPRRHGPRLPLATRRAAYEAWFRASYDEPNVAAVMPWGMTYPGQPGQPDGFAWGYRRGDDDDYASLTARWSQTFSADTNLAGCE
jgi:mannan endo-1,4-beta-mannosidase